MTRARDMVLEDLRKYRTRVAEAPHTFVKVTSAGYIPDKEFSVRFHVRELIAIDAMIARRGG